MHFLSVIVCTYNPDQEVFKRCLQAIERLEIPVEMSIECIIVDNNSKPNVETLLYVEEIVNRNKWMKIVCENRPGQSFARLTGCRLNKGDWVIFFDDDNEPSPDYLINLYRWINLYPEIGIWGPGRINVIYMTETEPWFNENKHYFQERNYNKLLIDNSKEMQYFYPPGTGIVVKKDILTAWADKFDAGLYSMGGRTGNFMDSSDDLQILYAGLNKGYRVGSAPNLSLNHLTPERKATFDYIKRLAFGISVSGPRMNNEIRQDAGKYKPTIPKAAKLYFDLLLFYSKYILVSKKRKRNFLIAYIHYFAGIAGNYRLINKRLPQPLILFMRHFNLEKAGSHKLV